MCIVCGKPVKKNAQTYCSHSCQQRHAYTIYVTSWIDGEETGSRGIGIKTLSAHVVRYVWERAGSKCELCGWDKVHPVSLKSPLQIHHIDDDADNNRPWNLQLLCPNCHALTENHGGRNRGKGRADRREKYIRHR